MECIQWNFWEILSSSFEQSKGLKVTRLQSESVIHVISVANNTKISRLKTK